MVCLSRPYTVDFFKGCLPQILPGPLLNTLPYVLADYPGVRIGFNMINPFMHVVKWTNIL